MTTRSILDAGLAGRTIGEGPPVYIPPTTFPQLELPSIVGEDKFVARAAITEHSTYFRFTATTNAGVDTVSNGFSVDWGNGIIESFNSGDFVEYLYPFESVGEYNGLYNQAIISIYPNGDDTLASIDLNHQPITVALSGKQNAPWLDIKVESATLSNLTISNHNNTIEYFEFITDDTTPSSPTVYNRTLYSVDINCPSIQDYSGMFSSCYSLTKVDIDFGNATNCDNMFYKCYSLAEINHFNLANLLTARGMFERCHSLDKVKLSLPKTTDISFMFYRCNALDVIHLDCPSATDARRLAYSCATISVAILDNSTSIESYRGAFYTCTTLESVTLSVDSAINLTYMFFSCPMLSNLPDWTFPVGEDFTSMLSGSGANPSHVQLLDLPNWTFPEGLVFDEMLRSRVIRRSPNWAFPRGTSFINFISGNYLLYVDLYLPAITNVAAIKNIASGPLLRHCKVRTPLGPYRDGGVVGPLHNIPLHPVPSGAVVRLGNDYIQEIPAIDLSLATSVSFSGPALVRIRAYGAIVDVTIEAGNLPIAALEEFYTNLGNVSASPKDIDVTGVPLASSADATIATAKGWVVLE